MTDQELQENQMKPIEQTILNQWNEIREVKMTDKEIQKIAGSTTEEIQMACHTMAYPSATIYSKILTSLAGVRDSQEEKLKTAREALDKIIKHGSNEQYVGDKVLTYYDHQGYIAKEALEKIGGGE